MIPDLVQWQKIDPHSGLCFPWFTHGFLDILKTWDLKNKTVLEYGGGKSSVWWANKCKAVYTIETNAEWLEYINFVLLHNHNFKSFHRQVNEGDQSQVDYYTELPEGCEPDIVVIDGVLRHECLLKALTLKRPLIVIHDNWQQDGFVCPASEEIMKPYEIHNFIQEDHTDNHGKKWATAYWELT